MKNLKTFVLLLVMQMATYSVFACSCTRDSLTEDRVKQAGAIFAGEVIRIDKDNDTYTETIHIKVNDGIKGVKKGEIIQVKTSMSSASCGVSTEVGQVWYMFVSKGSDGYHVSLCDRKRMISMNCSSIGTEYEEMERKELAKRKEDYNNDKKFIKKIKM